MTTFTLRHTADDKLPDLLDLLGKAQDFLHRGRAWRAFVARWGITDRMYGLEVTHGANGYHPHRHTVYGVKDWQPAETMNDGASRRAFSALFASELEVLWLAALRRFGGDGLPGIAVKVACVDGTEVEVVAKYVTKMAFETTRRVAKSARGESGRSPWQLLDDSVDRSLSATARARARGLFKEYAAAMSGRHGVWYSRRWRQLAFAAASLLPDDPGVEVLPLSADSWKLVVHLGAHAYLLELVEREGVEAAGAWLLMWKRRTWSHGFWDRPPDRLGALLDVEWVA